MLNSELSSGQASAITGANAQMLKTFRFMVVFSLLLQVIWLMLPMSWQMFYNAEQLELLSYSGFGAMDGIIAWYLAITAGFFITAIGLWQLKNWSRIAYVLVTLLAVFVIINSGISVAPAFDSLVYHLLALVDGAILTFMYLTPLKHEFN